MLQENDCSTQVNLRLAEFHAKVSKNAVHFLAAQVCTVLTRFQNSPEKTALLQDISAKLGHAFDQHFSDLKTLELNKKFSLHEGSDREF